MSYADILESVPIPRSKRGQPAWAVAFLFPDQGEWTEADYFAIEALRPVELVDGYLEVLPMPTIAHQLIVRFLFDLLRRFIREPDEGLVLFAPLPVHLRTQLIREPDVVFLRPERTRGRKYPEGADLVIEVVSEDEESRKRDLVEKRADYAAAGVSEYWIVDPEDRRISVLTLEGTAYRVHGEFGTGTTASSVLLPGFSASVDAVFAAGQAAS